MSLLQMLFIAACAIWWASEFFLSRTRRSVDDPSRDGGTLRMLTVALYGTIAVAVMLPILRIGLLPRSWSAPALVLGLALIVAGMAFRRFAIRTLGKQFTVDVGIQPGHALIRNGPYRLLRHPSYTGTLLCFYGLGIGLRDWASFLVIALGTTAAFVRRIHVEEAVLADAFGDGWRDHARRTWQLMPLLW